MRRRSLLAAVPALAALGFWGQGARAFAGSSDDLVAAARALAAAPHRPDRMALVPPFAGLGYDAYRAIQPRDGAGGGVALGDGVLADALPPGAGFADRVGVSLPGADAALAFSSDLFTFDPRFFPRGVQADPARDAGLGFSGLRLRAAFNQPDKLDEVLVLQGASYFRALPRGARYGLSARGLALGTGGAAPEEFPVTRHIALWGASDGRVDLGCLIDSPRASAALILRLAPGTEADPATRMDCALHLFPRVDLADAGIAPLTSMFLKNPLGPPWIDDFRPAVHDSDVLVIDTASGQRLWRPLQNPERMHLAPFADPSPRGYGLVQGVTRFDEAQDAIAAYHRRPSAWVEPLGDWGAGGVHLLELPTLDEYHDNIVAFWRPEVPLVAGVEHRFDYRLSWLPGGALALPPLAPPLAMVPGRASAGLQPGSGGAARLFVVDFIADPQGPGMRAVDDLAVDVAADSPGAYIHGVTHYRLVEGQGGLRVSFVLAPDAGTRTATLRLTIEDRHSGAFVAPVWMTRWVRRGDGRI